MKTYLIAVCVILPLLTSAQATSYGNFKVADQEIIYQKIFAHDSVTTEKLEKYYAALPYVSGVINSGSELSFSINDVVVDYKKFQFSQVSVPAIIQTGKYSGKVSIDVKDGRYRVTLRNIQMTGDIVYKKITTKENLTNYACRNNGTYISPDWTKPNTLGLLDKAFTDKLQFVDSGKTKDAGDW